MALRLAELPRALGAAAAAETMFGLPLRRLEDTSILDVADWREAIPDKAGCDGVLCCCAGAT